MIYIFRLMISNDGWRSERLGLIVTLASASIRCRNASAYDGWSAVLAGGLFIQTLADAASAAAYTRKR